MRFGLAAYRNVAKIAEGKEGRGLGLEIGKFRSVAYDKSELLIGAKEVCNGQAGAELRIK